MINYGNAHSYVSKQYNKFGEGARQKIMGLIQDEGILLKESFNYSVQKNASYQKVVNSTNKGEEEIYHTIFIPAFTDDSYIEQTIVAAHELGHYYVYKKVDKIKKIILNSGFKTVSYYNEKLAWKEAEVLLRSEEIINKDGEELQRKAYRDFLRLKSKGLKSYGHPLLTLFHITKKVAARLFYSYLFVTAILVFQENNIPIPFFNELGIKEFYPTVWAVFFVIFTFDIGSMLMTYGISKMNRGYK